MDWWGNGGSAVAGLSPFTSALEELTLSGEGHEQTSRNPLQRRASRHNRAAILTFCGSLLRHPFQIFPGLNEETGAL